MAELGVTDRLQRHYDDYYGGDETAWRRLGALDKADNVAALCAALPHRSVLEVGAGDGAVLERLAEIGFGEELHALEISSSGVAAIESRSIPRLRSVRRFDGHTVPDADGAYDLAILSHVIEHAEYPRRLLYEASRVARHLFVEVPLEDTWRLASDFVPDRVGHINFYSPASLRRLVQTCDLEVLRQTATNPSRRVYVHRLGRKGVLYHGVKELLLATLPALATRLFTYHGSLTCRRPPAGAACDRPGR